MSQLFRVGVRELQCPWVQPAGSAWNRSWGGRCGWNRVRWMKPVGEKVHKMMVFESFWP